MFPTRIKHESMRFGGFLILRHGFTVSILPGPFGPEQLRIEMDLFKREIHSRKVYSSIKTAISSNIIMVRHVIIHSNK